MKISARSKTHVQEKEIRPVFLHFDVSYLDLVFRISNIFHVIKINEESIDKKFNFSHYHIRVKSCFID